MLPILVRNKSDCMWGNSLVVQWLGLGTFTGGACVQSLFGELRSHKPHCEAKKKKVTECAYVTYGISLPEH